MNEKMTWMPTSRTLFSRGVLRRSSFLGNLKALHKKLDLWRTPNKILYCLFIFSSIPSFASNNHVLGWTSWPTGALLHRSVNQPWDWTTTCSNIDTILSPTVINTIWGRKGSPCMTTKQERRESRRPWPLQFFASLLRFRNWKWQSISLIHHNLRFNWTELIIPEEWIQRPWNACGVGGSHKIGPV